MSILRRWQRDLNTFGLAEFSEDMVYRYQLEVRWGDGRAINFLMLNPSTADEQKNDPTVERCERRARAWGYPAVLITNLFAFRSTDPHALTQAEDPIGPANNDRILAAYSSSAKTVAAWGVHGDIRNRAHSVKTLLYGLPLYYLKLSKKGHPMHPLYIPYDYTPILFREVTR